MHGVWQLLRSCGGTLIITGVFLAMGTRVWAGEPLHTPRRSPISESEVSPHSRPLTHAQLLDEYLVRLQEQLKFETRAIEESGLVEVKLTIRKDGTVTFAEIVVLDGAATLRNDLLPVLNQLEPLSAPPIEADLLTVSMLLPLRYPGPDLLDTIDQAP